MKQNILVVEDNLILGNILEKWLVRAGYGVIVTTDEPSARQKISECNIVLVLTDVRLPKGDGISLLEWNVKQRRNIPFVVMTEYASIGDAVRAVKLGAKDYLPKPVHEEQLLELLRGLLKLPISISERKKLLERKSSAMQETERIARRVASSSCSVIILGPNGSGKESIARLIHQYSKYKNGAFVAVNCGCIPKDLAASEFFGYIKGAFTGAEKDMSGYLGVAEGGTLFLDEVGNMSSEMQMMLLRVLQEKTYRPIGSRREKTVNVRILSATNENIGRAIEEGRFREDLYHRLAEFELHQPSLAECLEDILPLADFFRRLHSEEMRIENIGFTEEAENALLAYSWSGNVRELSNCIRRAVLLADSPLLTYEDLGLNIDTLAKAKNKRKVIGEVCEKERIGKTLEENNGNVSRTAEILGMSRVTLYKKMRKYGF